MNNLKVNILLTAIKNHSSYNKVKNERVMRTYFAGLSTDGKKHFNQFFIALTGKPFEHFAEYSEDGTEKSSLD